MIPAREASVQRKITEAFVMADPEDVVLSRKSKVSNGAGGWTSAYAPLATGQTCRLVPTQSATERTTADGRLVVAAYALVGLYGTSMERGDRFTLNGRDYEIVYVFENQEYQTKAEVIDRG